MKPHVKLAEAAAPGGGRLTLHEHDGTFCIRINGQILMDSAATASETLLGELAVNRPLAALTAAPHILIGGLGLGFTLRRVLAGVGPDARVTVAELIPDVIEWNRTHLHGLNGGLLDDPRVALVPGDVAEFIRRAPAASCDAVLLDVDNGPVAMVQAANRGLYSREGIGRIAAMLRPGGRAAIWSASRDDTFADRLAAGGFAVEAVPARTYPAQRRPAHLIYVADKVN
ncbi:MAG: spermine synthase [Opitutaceae bacterium]|nr:spermine synthase [Opitutaceae bacterium]